MEIGLGVWGIVISNNDKFANNISIILVLNSIIQLSLASMLLVGSICLIINSVKKRNSANTTNPMLHLFDSDSITGFNDGNGTEMTYYSI